ncbi:helix-turn-helix DNA binding protein [Mycobacterium phage Sejanus]|nr:helix-turn-helix DNA binding protein [Mycobacterium phage Sejanus]
MSDNEEHAERRPRWATKAEAAQHLGVHPNTVTRWANDGRITTYHFGPRLIRFDLNEIDAMGTAAAVRRS